MKKLSILLIFCTTLSGPLKPGYYKVVQTFYGHKRDQMAISAQNSGVTKVDVLNNGMRVHFAMLNGAQTYIAMDDFKKSEIDDNTLVYAKHLEPQLDLKLYFLRAATAKKHSLKYGELTISDAVPNSPNDTVIYKFYFAK